jgi:tRNA pseudouridine38-40 synthase
VEQTYRIDLKYVGGPFHGWQSQPSGSGVQDHVEKALATMLRHQVRVIGASRTDSGVHAEHQVGIFRTTEPFAERQWLKSLYGLLHDSIGVSSIQPVPAEFHPVYAARGKAYRYCIWVGATRNPQVAPYCWQLFQELDLDAIRAGAQALVGTHDFSSFCAADSSAKTRQRTILEIDVARRGPLVDLWVVGHGFLKQMVRIIVGTLVDAGLGRLPADGVAKVLAARDRTQAGRTAPAQGLSLVEIFYDQVPAVAQLKARCSADFCLRIE